MTWGLASLALMSVLSVGLSSAGRSEKLPPNEKSNCWLPQTFTGHEGSASLLVELDGQLVRLKDCEGVKGDETSAHGVLAPVPRRAVGESRRAPEVKRGERFAAPANHSSLLYYLPEEDGYVTLDPAID